MLEQRETGYATILIVTMLHVQCTLFVQQHPPFFKVPTSDLICLTSKELTFKRYKQFVSEPTVDADTDCL